MIRYGALVGSDRIGSDLSWSSWCASSSSPSSCPDSNQLHHSQKGFVLHDVLTSFFLSDGRSVDRLMDLPFRQPKPITNHDRTNQNLVARVSTTGGKRERERREPETPTATSFDSRSAASLFFEPLACCSFNSTRSPIDVSTTTDNHE